MAPTPAPRPAMPAVLPPLPRRGEQTSELNPAQRRTMIVGILALHVAGAWGLMQVDAVRDAVLESAPMFVDLINPPAAPRPPEPPPLPPPKPLPKAPPPLPVIAAAPNPAPAPFVVPAPPPEPSPPAPPQVVAVAPAPPAPPAPPPAPKLIAESAAEYTERGELVYPRLSTRAGETGTVLVRAYIDVNGGAPRSTQVSKSSGFNRLDEACTAAVRKSRFRPYTENGKALDVWVAVPCKFELER